MSTHLTWSALQAGRPLSAAEKHTLARLREGNETEPDFRFFLGGLGGAFPGVTWQALIGTETRQFVFFEVDDDGVFSEQASFSLNPHQVEPPPRSADDDHVIAACAPGTGARVASVIEQAWADDGGELIEDEDRVRIPMAWRSRRHAKWAFTSIAPDLVAPLALVINVDRWRSGRLVREHHSVVLRSGGAVIRPVWLVVPDDDEWTEAAQLLLTGSDASEDE